MADILVIANWEKEKDKYGYPTGRTLLIASHGFDLSTDQAVVLPGEHPSALGAKFDENYQEWIICG